MHQAQFKIGSLIVGVLLLGLSFINFSGSIDRNLNYFNPWVVTKTTLGACYQGVLENIPIFTHCKSPKATHRVVSTIDPYSFANGSNCGDLPGISITSENNTIVCLEELS